MQYRLPPHIRDAGILFGTVAVLITIVRPAIVSAQNTASTQLCIQNVSQLAGAISGYAQDYDEYLPQLSPPATLAAYIQPYSTTSVAYLLTCPLTERPYIINTSVSGKSLAALPGGPGDTYLAQDSVPHNDGKYTVGFADGSILYGGVAVPPTAQDANTQCISNQKRIGLAFLEYSQDYDENLPVYRSTADFQAALTPYAGTNASYTCPVTSQPYVANRTLSGTSLANNPSPATAKVLQDTRPHPTGVITTTYLDGHVKQLGQ